MRKLTIEDIKDLRAYERERVEFRARIIEIKQRRRFTLGDLMTITFENFDTMRFQVQEMARAERILLDTQIEHEIAIYNELIPDGNELVGTLFIEINDPDALRHWLPKLVGIEEHVVIEAGGHSSRGVGQDAERLTRDDITSAVHYLEFPFDAAAIEAFRSGPAAIVVDHPAYQARHELTADERQELLGDLVS